MRRIDAAFGRIILLCLLLSAPFDIINDSSSSSSSSPYLTVVAFSAGPTSRNKAPPRPERATPTTAADESLGVGGCRSTSRMMKSTSTTTSTAMAMTAAAATASTTTTTAQKEGERLGSRGFHHIEFYCGDARSTALVFCQALGMTIQGESHQGTGNDRCVSYGLVSNNVRLVVTAPYSRRVVSRQQQQQQQQLQDDVGAAMAQQQQEEQQQEHELVPGTYPLPGFAVDTAHEWIAQHGTFVRAIGIVVDDVTVAYHNALSNGGVGLLSPTKLGNDSRYAIAELQLYGHVVLRLLSDAVAACDTVLPHLVVTATDAATAANFGLERMDHIVGNVPVLHQTRRYIEQMTGYHEFAEFTAQEVGTVESGLNSVVLANEAETILLPLNEPVMGTVRKSQIQTYLEQNEGPGVQHVALKTRDIIATIRHMRASPIKFDLMKRPNDEYYHDLPNRLGDQLTPEQYQSLEELGILADADEEGVLLQIFTKPIGDRPTFFFEIIQRIGCPVEPPPSQQQGETATTTKATTDHHHWWSSLDERPGCGGFGRGNFRALFKSIEEHEKTLKV